MESPLAKKQLSRNFYKPILLALGANVPGAWGGPYATLRMAMQHLASNGIYQIEVSPIYETKAHGQIRQPPYLNLVATAKSAASPRQLLDIAKQIERDAGRRLVGRNGPRPLDIDLIDYAGRIINWPAGLPRPKLVLPHPLMSERPFVLVPLVELDPHWRHPVLGLSARHLLIRQGGLHQFLLRREISRVDSRLVPCEESDNCA